MRQVFFNEDEKYGIIVNYYINLSLHGTRIYPIDQLARAMDEGLDWWQTGKMAVQQ